VTSPANAEPAPTPTTDALQINAATNAFFMMCPQLGSGGPSTPHLASLPPPTPHEHRRLSTLRRSHFDVNQSDPVQPFRRPVLLHTVDQMDALVTTLEGHADRERIDVPVTPVWWSLASCRGDGADSWIVERGNPEQLAALRKMCAGCPVSGDCLADAISLEANVRHVGPVRCGITGRGWHLVEALVAELQPATPEEWSVVAAWCVDGDVKKPGRKQTVTA
jgi:hypothetical protein